MMHTPKAGVFLVAAVTFGAAWSASADDAIVPFPKPPAAIAKAMPKSEQLAIEALRAPCAALVQAPKDQRGAITDAMMEKISAILPGRAATAWLGAVTERDIDEASASIVINVAPWLKLHTWYFSWMDPGDTLIKTRTRAYDMVETVEPNDMVLFTARLLTVTSDTAGCAIIAKFSAFVRVN